MLQNIVIEIMKRKHKRLTIVKHAQLNGFNLNMLIYISTKYIIGKIYT